MSPRIRSAVAALLTALALFAWADAALAQKLRVVCYNVESGGAKVGTVAKRVEEIANEDLWGFSEVQDANWAQQFATAAKDSGADQEFKVVMGTTGAPDLLAIVYNDKRLEFISKSELHELNDPDRWRSPLVARFKLRESGQEFFFMVNHLARGNSDHRHAQAKGLNTWVQGQSLPVIAVGDYNFDFNTRKSGERFLGDLDDRDKGFDHMVAGGHFKWIRPDRIVPTNASSHKSVLDFVFVAGKARDWKATSSIIEKSGDFPDDSTTSDHRPVQADFEMSDVTAGAVRPGDAVRKAIELRITDLERQLRELREELKKFDR